MPLSVSATGPIAGGRTPGSRMVLGEAEPPAARRGGRPDRQRGARRAPRPRPSRPTASMSGPATSTGFAAPEPLGERARSRPGRAPRGRHPALRRVLGVAVVGVGVPVVHRDRDEHRALRRKRREVDARAERGGNVLRRAAARSST